MREVFLYFVLGHDFLRSQNALSRPSIYNRRIKSLKLAVVSLEKNSQYSVIYSYGTYYGQTLDFYYGRFYYVEMSSCIG